MKTFNDLEFKTHPNLFGFSTQARIFFPNGYGASVITGQSAYSNEEKPYITKSPHATNSHALCQFS